MNRKMIGEAIYKSIISNFSADTAGIDIGKLKLVAQTRF
jgi:hypothetical protein